VISVKRQGDLYVAEASPPHAAKWQSLSPLTASGLVRQLEALGADPRDVWDAIRMADGEGGQGVVGAGGTDV